MPGFQASPEDPPWVHVNWQGKSNVQPTTLAKLWLHFKHKAKSTSTSAKLTGHDGKRCMFPWAEPHVYDMQWHFHWPRGDQVQPQLLPGLSATVLEELGKTPVSHLQKGMFIGGTHAKPRLQESLRVCKNKERWRTACCYSARTALSSAWREGEIVLFGGQATYLCHLPHIQDA